MAEIVVMPAMGNTVEACVLIAWRVAVGDSVDASTVLAEIETDKSSMEVPVGAAGTVLALLAAEGDEVPVRQPIAIVGAPGEDVTGLGGSSQADAAPAVPEAAAAQPGAPVPAGEPLAAPEAAGVGPTAPLPPEIANPTAPLPPGVADPTRLAASPRARRLAEKSGIDLAGVAGTGPQGRIIVRDVAAATPFTTIGARGLGDSTNLGATGSGLGGRLTRADLEASAASAGAAGPADTADQGAVSQTPLVGVRKIIAERMMASLANSAQLTYTATAPADRLLAARARFKAADPGLGWGGVTIGDLVGFAAVQALLKQPRLNAWLVDGVIHSFTDVHLGLAVDTPRGLLVPTIRQASRLTLRQFSTRCKDLAAQATAGSISPDLLQGATFTVTNLGSYGVESFTPLLNLPQVAILGVDAIRPAVVIQPDGTIGAEQRIGLSLTADHRVVDGADAARYLKDLCAIVADIDLIVLGQAA